MATSYTTLLGLALPATGELSGTWGDTVNNYISNYIDAAVAGAQTVTTDTTLTKTTNASLGSTSSQYAIIIASPASANITITAPAASKIYTIINTSGTYTVKICGAGPTTGVTLGVNEKAQVAWNGSDFIKISNTGGAASFTNVTVTGTTTLSGLTASTALALDASKNVVSVTNTGTGNNVLSASPTLTGTIAGASLSLSSLTSGRVTYAGTSGLLQDSANLTFDGTNLGVGGSGDPFGRFYGRSVGLTSSSSAFFEINAATGSSSGIDFGVNASRTAGITSNTTETNFTTLGATPLLFGINGSEQMRLTSTGLGIGTSSPGYKLEVTGTAAISGAVTLSGGTASGVAYLNGSKVLTTGSALTFDGAGTLVSGAGGTGTNNSVLRLNGSDASSYGSYLQFQRNSVNKWTIGTDSGINGGTSDDLTIFGTASQRFYASSTEQMRLTSTGLGIGTSSPASKLDVTGNARFAGTTNSVKFSIINTGGETTIARDDSTGSQFGVAYATNFFATGAYPMLFWTNGNERMRLDSSGNLGIGGTANNYAGFKTLAVIGPDATHSGIVRVRTSDDAIGMNIYADSTGPLFNTTNNPLRFLISDTERMRLDSSGNLGLGVTPSAWTTSSTAKAFEIGTVGNALYGFSGSNINLTSGAYYNSGWKYAVSSLPVSYYNQSNGVHSWYNAPSGTAGNAITFTQAMTLDASGNLLVGTTSSSGAGAGIVLSSSGVGSFTRNNVNYVNYISNLTTSGNAGFITFQYGTSQTEIGSISTATGTVTLYNTTSDQRLKENIQDAESASDLIDAIQVRQFDWKSDNTHQRYGFVAQELVTIAPEAVYQPQDEDKMMAVDYSKLVPMLVKEIQSLRIRIAQLEAK